jgi:anti-sigma factor RsiW
MLSCRQVQVLLTDVLDGDGPTGAFHSDISRHLLGCDGCLGHAARIQRSRRMGATTAAEPLSAAARHALLVAYRKWARG